MSCSVVASVTENYWHQVLAQMELVIKHISTDCGIMICQKDETIISWQIF
jgi:hypothetical protein